MGHVAAAPRPGGHDAHAHQTEPRRQPAGRRRCPPPGGPARRPWRPPPPATTQRKCRRQTGSTPGACGPRETVVPGADVAQPAAPGRPHHQDAGGEQDGHEQAAAPVQGAGQDQRRHRQVQPARHEEAVQARQPQQQLAEEHEREEQPDPGPQQPHAAGFAQAIGQPAGVEGQGRRLPPAAAGQEALQQDHGARHHQVHHRQQAARAPGTLPGPMPTGIASGQARRRRPALQHQRRPAVATATPPRMRAARRRADRTAGRTRPGSRRVSSHSTAPARQQHLHGAVGPAAAQDQGPAAGSARGPRGPTPRPRK